MLFVVVVLAMMFIVVCFLFLSEIDLSMSSGPLALLYCSSYYDLRGGHSYGGAYCGALFVVAASSSAGLNSWYSGAVLSLLHIMLIVVVILALMSLVVRSVLLLMILLVLLTGLVVPLYDYFILSYSRWFF